MGSFYQLLGLDPDATVDEIKKSYRALAKQYHPDKNIGDNTTELFQRLNSAYHTLTNPVSRREYDVSLGISRVDEEQILDNSNYTLNARENTYSVTIDISESMFLVLRKESQRHHDTKPTDRGHHGLQLRAPYVSPSDQVQYGTISLTFYPSTSRLLVQGTSYMLWVEEHLPLIYQSAEINYMEDALKWCNLSTQQQIGRNKRRSALRGRTRHDTPSPSEAAPVTLCLPTSPTKAPSLPPGDNGASDPDPMVQEGDKTAINYCPSDDAPDVATSVVPDVESLRSPIAPQHPRAGIPTRNSACVPKNSGAKKCTTKQGKKKKQKSKEPKMSVRPIKKTLKPDKKSNSATTKSEYHKTTPMVMNDGTEHNGVSPQYCKENCPHNGVHLSEMIRCSTCMHWFHMSCVGEDPKHVGVWCCHDCRTMPASLRSLQLQVSELVICMQDFKSRQCNQETIINQLKTENANLRNKVKHMHSHNEELAKLIQTMSDEPTAITNQHATHMSPNEKEQSWSKVISGNRFAVLASPDGNSCDTTTELHEPTPRSILRHNRQKPKVGNKKVQWAKNSAPQTVKATTPPRPQSIPSASPRHTRQPSVNTRGRVKVSIIGSSNARNVAPLVNNKHIDATGFIYPGYTAGQIAKRIRNTPLTGATVIHAGTNNLEAQPLAKCMAELRELMDSVHNQNPNSPMIVCEIPYRYDKSELNDKVDRVNNYLKRLCQGRPTYHLLPHDYNHEDYTKDRLHLNERGKTKLAYEIRRILRNINSE